MPRTAPSGANSRATGLSLAAIVLVLACFGAMVVLHLTRTDLDPARQVMSEYANGRFGWFMTMVFYAMGLACIVVAVRVDRAIQRRALSVRSDAARPRWPRPDPGRGVRSRAAWPSGSSASRW